MPSTIKRIEDYLLCIRHFEIGSELLISSCKMVCHAFIKHSQHVPPYGNITCHHIVYLTSSKFGRSEGFPIFLKA